MGLGPLHVKKKKKKMLNLVPTLSLSLVFPLMNLECGSLVTVCFFLVVLILT